MKVDFKITTWERVEISEEHKEEVFAKIKDGTITSANDLFNLTLSNGKQMDLECKRLDNVDEQMTVEENEGCSTVEVLSTDGDVIFTNAKDS